MGSSEHRAVGPFELSFQPEVEPGIFDGLSAGRTPARGLGALLRRGFCFCSTRWSPVLASDAVQFGTGPNPELGRAYCDSVNTPACEMVIGKAMDIMEATKT